MITLGSVLWFDMNVVAAEIAKRNELDVNGRITPIARSASPPRCPGKPNAFTSP